ncbi:MAG: hypothetical protein KGQ26_06735 [Rhodospirillales bacterium]|nr:hypothetical protein [Rhodospirillales bacterium]
MANLIRTNSRKDALILEYKLLVSGKIVPDTGETKADVELRLRQIEQALLGSKATELNLHPGPD